MIQNAPELTFPSEMQSELNTKSYVPYDLYPAFSRRATQGRFSSALRLNALFFDRCVIAADILATSDPLVRALEANKGLLRSNRIEIAAYDDRTRLIDHLPKNEQTVNSYRLMRLEDEGLKIMRYNPANLSSQFRDRVVSWLRDRGEKARLHKSKDAIKRAIEEIMKKDGMFTLEDALRLQTGMRIDRQLKKMVLLCYSSVGAQGVNASAILPHEIWNLATNDEQQHEERARHKRQMLEYAHSVVLELFFMPSNALDCINDDQFAKFVISSPARSLTDHLRNICESVEQDTTPCDRRGVDAAESLLQTKRKLRNLIYEEISKEQKKITLNELGWNSLDEIAGAFVPGAGIYRKMLATLGRAFIKRKQSEINFLICFRFKPT